VVLIGGGHTLGERKKTRKVALNDLDFLFCTAFV